MVSYKKKGVEKTSAYAFLKIGNKFGLGDIDQGFFRRYITQ